MACPVTKTSGVDQSDSGIASQTKKSVRGRGREGKESKWASLVRENITP